MIDSWSIYRLDSWKTDHLLHFFLFMLSFALLIEYIVNLFIATQKCCQVFTKGSAGETNAIRWPQITSDDKRWHYMTQDDKKLIECRIHLQELVRRYPKFPGGKAQRPLQDLQLVRREILRHPKVSRQGLLFQWTFSTRVRPDAAFLMWQRWYSSTKCSKVAGWSATHLELLPLLIIAIRGFWWGLKVSKQTSCW